MKINQLNFMIGGMAGDGVDRPGALFAQMCVREGLHVHSTAEFYSVIKGYNSVYQMRVSPEPLYSHLNHYDLILAFDKQTTERHLSEVVPGGGVIYDPAIAGEELKRDDIFLFPVPLKQIAKEKAGLDLAKNIVGLGAVIGLLDYSLDDFLKMIGVIFGKKGEVIVKKNVEAAQAGYDYIRQNFKHEFNYRLQPIESEKKMLIDGNEIMALGAIKAGCKFVSEYPMTPSTSVLHSMARHSRQHDISVNHVEDEISAINMAVGAGYAGVRALVGTSGGGFALMTEAVGLAGMLEVPVVLIEAQRPGPSTGLPTRTGQGDLRQVLHASQGDFPKIVMAPGTHEEAFYMAFEAFNLAEKYQCPVMILSEKYLSEGRSSVPFLKHDHLKINRGKLLKESEIPEGFKRFAESEDGISPRTIPGQKGGAHTASSYEHREDGYFTEEIDDCISIHARRMRKMETALAEIPKAKLEGEANAQVTLVCWGATYGPAREAMEWLKKDGVSANLLHVKYFSPFQPGVKEILEVSTQPILIEGNISAQLGGLITEKTGFEIQDKILDWSGRPFTPDGIAQKVMEILKK